jgi:hypothetical protein
VVVLLAWDVATITAICCCVDKCDIGLSREKKKVENILCAHANFDGRAERRGYVLSRGIRSAGVPGSLIAHVSHRSSHSAVGETKWESF